MRRSWKTFFVSATVVLTAVNPASASRGRFWRCCPPPSCYVECSPCVVVDDCCGQVSSELPTPTEMPSTPAPSQPSPRTPTPAAPPAPVPPMPEDTFPPLPSTPVEPPADEPLLPEPTAPADDMPLPTETPAEPPADEPAAPTDTPAKPADDVEDLFKDTDTKPADEPPAEPADTTPAKPADDVEDLFKETDDKKAANSEPAEEEPMNPAPSSEVEDLFSEPIDKPSTSASIDARPADVEEAGPMRLWTDNTGKYQVRARLLVVGDHHVKLLKETGKTTTVPFSRLSGSDLAFVQHQVSSELAGNF